MKVYILIIALLVAGWFVGYWFPDSMLLGAIFGGTAGGIFIARVLKWGRA